MNIPRLVDAMRFALKFVAVLVGGVLALLIVGAFFASGYYGLGSLVTTVYIFIGVTWMCYMEESDV